MSWVIHYFLGSVYDGCDIRESEAEYVALKTLRKDEGWERIGKYADGAPDVLAETTEDAPAGDDEPEEASEDVRETEAPQEDAEDRRVTTDNLYRILKEHPEGMTTRDIAEVLGMDMALNGTRVRINQKLNKLNRSGYARQVGTRAIPTGQSVPVWEAVQ